MSRKPKRSGETLSREVGKRIRRRRGELGLTQDEVAARTNGQVSAESVSKYERGVQPGLEKFLWLCAALDVGVLELLPQEARDVLSCRRYGCKVTLHRALMGENLERPE